MVKHRESDTFGLRVYSAQAMPTTVGGLVLLQMDDATSTNGGVLRIIQDSAGGGAFAIRIDDPNPDIELVESDQTSPAGKFELAVQGDIFQINGRASDDMSFQTAMRVHRVANRGGYQLTVAPAGAATSPASDEVRFYIREDVDVAGTATNDCVLRYRLNDGTEGNVAVLNTDAGCP